MSTLSLAIKEKKCFSACLHQGFKGCSSFKEFRAFSPQKQWELQDFRVPQIPQSLVLLLEKKTANPSKPYLAPGEENSNFIAENRAGNVMYPYPCALSQILPSCCAGNVEQSHEASLQSRFPSSPGRGFAFYKNLQQL